MLETPLKGDYVGTDSASGERIFKDVGRSLEYQNRVNRHYKELEAELGVEDPQPLYESDVFMAESDAP